MKRVSLHTVTLFVASVGFGVLMSLASLKFKVGVSNQILKLNPVDHDKIYKQWLETRNLKDNKGQTEAEYLKRNIKVLCMVMVDIYSAYNPWRTSEAPNIDPSEYTISITWGKRCTKTLYFSGKKLVLPSIPLNTTTRSQNWKAVREAFIYVAAKQFQNQYDWYLIVEEDTFIIYENLLYYLSVFDANKPYYFGHALVSWGSEHNAISPGTVISHGALRKLHGLLIKGHCPASSSSGDWELGKCLANVGIQVQDTRDHLGRARFLMYQPESVLIPNTIPWTNTFWTNTKYTSKEKRTVTDV